jgi:hypothetical protein
VVALITAAPGMASAAFTGSFDVSGWTLTNTNPLGAEVGGAVDLSDAPATITLTSGDQEVSGATDFTILVPFSGIVSFDWLYVTHDLWEIALNDAFGYLVNDTFSILPDSTLQQGQQPQTGHVSQWLRVGDRFGFRIATDGYYGPAVATVSNFDLTVPEPATGMLIGLGLGVAGRMRQRTRIVRALATG